MGPIARAVVRTAPPDGNKVTPVWFLILAAACAVLVAMVFLVFGEVFLPSGSIPGPLEWRRIVLGRLARSRRYAQILRILLRHGLAPYLRGRRHDGLDGQGTGEPLARALREALDEGGVTFVKFGQVLSTRRDLLPAEFVNELSRLQDQAGSAPWPEVSAVLMARVGRGCVRGVRPPATGRRVDRPGSRGATALR